MYQRLSKGLTISIGLFMALFMVLGMLAHTAVAQEGHPLKGSWIGEWTGNTTHGDFVLIVMDWNGEEVTGMINPGTDNMAISNVELDPSEWTVEIEAGGYTIEAVIENLELPTRSLVGTWRNGNRRGDFEIIRQ